MIGIADIGIGIDSYRTDNTDTRAVVSAAYFGVIGKTQYCCIGAAWKISISPAIMPPERYAVTLPFPNPPPLATRPTSWPLKFGTTGVAAVPIWTAPKLLSIKARLIAEVTLPFPE